MSTGGNGTALPDEGTVRRATAAAAMGNCMEWYDFAVYSYVAAIIGAEFFPSGDEAAQLLSALGVFAASFLIRPFGGLFFGPLGDRIGRQHVLAVTIILMSAATFAIGVLPTYAQVGVFAPILLILARLVQGFSTGGEYGGAATFISEYAPSKRRGFLGSWLEFGTLTGFGLGATIVTVLMLALPPADMQSWGWRIPFLIGGPLGLIGLYLRTKLEDTPEFKKLAAKGETSKTPLADTLRYGWREIVLCVGVVIVLNVSDYVLLTYMPTYLSSTLHVEETHALMLVVLVIVGMLAAIVPLGRLSDRIGRKPLLLTCCIGFLIFSYPALRLVETGRGIPTFIGLAVLGFFLVCYLAVVGSTLPALFTTRVRYGSMAIGYNISTSLFGGTAPFMVTLLMDTTGNDMTPAFYLMGAAAISLLPILRIPETVGVPMSQVGRLRMPAARAARSA